MRGGLECAPIRGENPAPIDTQCDQRGWEYGSTQVREMATELIAEFQDQLKS
jgi:hypothetical protein